MIVAEEVVLIQTLGLLPPPQKIYEMHKFWFIKLCYLKFHQY